MDSRCSTPTEKDHRHLFMHVPCKAISVPRPLRTSAEQQCGFQCAAPLRKHFSHCFSAVAPPQPYLCATAGSGKFAVPSTESSHVSGPNLRTLRSRVGSFAFCQILSQQTPRPVQIHRTKSQPTNKLCDYFPFTAQQPNPKPSIIHPQHHDEKDQ